MQKAVIERRKKKHFTIEDINSMLIEVTNFDRRGKEMVSWMWKYRLAPLNQQWPVLKNSNENSHHCLLADFK